ncbi:MAG: high frequency lysogenization protein HflD [Gammaproteobacteria bacterium]
MTSYQDRTLALAGILQACYLVQQVARKNTADSTALEASLGSVLKIDAESTASVYGDAAGVALGLRRVREQLGKETAQRDLELTRYAIGVMHLERQLAKRPDMLEKIRIGVEKTQAQTAHFPTGRETLGSRETGRQEQPLTHSNVIASLAGIYSDTLSALTPRIMVQGEQGYLSNPDNTNKVRALLLAAIRSAVLWRQAGGRRWQLIFARNTIVQEAEKLLRSSST